MITRETGACANKKAVLSQGICTIPSVIYTQLIFHLEFRDDSIAAFAIW